MLNVFVIVKTNDMFKFNVQPMFLCYVHTNRLASTRCTHVGRRWMCTDIFKLIIDSGASVMKCVKTVEEETKTTNPKAVSSGHIETNMDIHKMKELSASVNYNVSHSAIWLIYLTYF